MNYIDTWLWVELFSSGQEAKKTVEILMKLKKEGLLITSAITLLETKYRLGRELGKENAQEAIRGIEMIEGLTIVPVLPETCKFAAELRLKYYDKKIRALSTADVLHLATAIQTGCRALYSGDSDFQNIEEIETVIV